MHILYAIVKRERISILLIQNPFFSSVGRMLTKETDKFLQKNQNPTDTVLRISLIKYPEQ
jgi:hypothetical protein